MSEQEASQQQTQGPGTLDPLPTTLEEETGPDAAENWIHKLLRTIFSPSAGTVAIAIVVALIIGALIVVAFDSKVQQTAGYLFAAPGDFFGAVWHAFSSFFTALFRGSIFDWTQPTAAAAFRPLTETVVRSIPLIIAGLAIAVAFTGGMFNIGVQGQIIIGALVGGYVGFAWNLPIVIHVLVAMVAAVIGGALWGFIPGILRARLGANEVIVTIMLNSIALFFLAAMLNTTTFHGSGYAGKSMAVKTTAMYPQLLGSNFRLHFGFIVAILAAIFVWWLLDRSTIGFELRAAGANPEAARTAGINVKNTIMWTLVISGALAGLAATAPVLGTEKAITGGVAGTIGFDAITVALLGRSRPLGVFFAGLLFGGLNAGGALMQSSAGIPVEIVQITQAVIVLMIAASEAIRYARSKRAEKEKTVQKVEEAPAPVDAEAKGVVA